METILFEIGIKQIETKVIPERYVSYSWSWKKITDIYVLIPTTFRKWSKSPIDYLLNIFFFNKHPY